MLYKVDIGTWERAREIPLRASTISSVLTRAQDYVGREEYIVQVRLNNIVVWDVFHGDLFTPKPGDRVICRSNNDEPPLIGELVRYEEYPGGDLVPLVTAESDGSPWFVLGPVVPYCDDLLRKLDTMSPDAQWEYLRRDTGDYWKHFGLNGGI